MSDEPDDLDEVQRRVEEIQRRKRGRIRWQIGKHTAELAIEAHRAAAEVADAAESSGGESGGSGFLVDIRRAAPSELVASSDCSTPPIPRFARDDTHTAPRLPRPAPEEHRPADRVRRERDRHRDVDPVRSPARAPSPARTRAESPSTRTRTS